MVTWEINKTKENILSEISTLINKTVVKFDNKYYLKTEGVPQGSVLSPILCALYYSELDKLIFNKMFVTTIKGVEWLGA